MRALRRVSGSFIVLGAFALACDDGSDVATSTSVVQIPGGSAALAVGVIPDASHVSRTRDFRAAPNGHAHGGTRAAFVPVAPDPRRPIDGASLDNAVCEDAARLGAGGAVDVPVGGGHGEGCFESPYSQRFFDVTVEPGEVLTVSTPSSDARVGDLWFTAAPACDAPSAACLIGWTWLHGGVALANPGRLPVERVVAVITREDVTETSYDLEVRKDPLARNTTCGRAEPIGDGLAGESFAGASVEAADSQIRRALYYSVAIAPMSRARVHLDPESSLYLYARRSCGDDLFSLPSGDIANPSDETISAVITVASVWQVETRPFDLIVERSELLPEASCETPRAMTIGDAATIDVAGGGDGPSVCWCFRPERAMHVSVTVPPGATAVVSGVSSIDSGATLIEMPDACGDTCGDNVGFGWGASPGVLRLENAGPDEAVRRVLVTSNAIWQEDGSVVFPPVELTITAAE